MYLELRAYWNISFIDKSVYAWHLHCYYSGSMVHWKKREEKRGRKVTGNILHCLGSKFAFQIKPAHTHAHARTHRNTHIHKHACTNTCKHTDTRACTHPHPTCTHAHTKAQTHTNRYACTCVHTQTQTHVRAHARRHVHMQKCAHTFTHTCTLMHTHAHSRSHIHAHAHTDICSYWMMFTLQARWSVWMFTLLSTTLESLLLYKQSNSSHLFTYQTLKLKWLTYI